MISKKRFIMATLTVTAAGLLVFTTGGSKDKPANKLEGAWVVKAPLPSPLPTGQWTMTMTPTDPSGRAAVISGTIQVPVPPALICPATGQASPPAYNFETSREFVGEAVMTGPRTATATMIGYSRNDAGQVTFIWMGVGDMTFTGPGKSTATSTLAYYLPKTDTNVDGIPEDAPFCVIGPGQSDAVRVGVIPLPGLPH